MTSHREKAAQEENQTSEGEAGPQSQLTAGLQSGGSVHTPSPRAPCNSPRADGSRP